MKRWLSLLTVVISLFSLQVDAQQDAQYTGYMHNQLVINPAYAGARGVNSALAYYRHQWAHISSAPRTLAVSLHGPIAQKKMGIGVQIESDWIGIHNRLSAFVSYAYKIQVANNGVLSFGIQGGILNYSSDFTKLTVRDGFDPTFTQDTNTLRPNFGAGVYYNTQNFYLGASVPHLINQEISERDARQTRHYFFTGGFVVPLGDNVQLKPAAIVKYIPNEAPISADITANFILFDKLWIGGAYRFEDAVSALLMYQFNQKFRMGYSYDYTLSEIQNIQGTHDVFLGYEWGFDNDKVISPRYF